MPIPPELGFIDASAFTVTSPDVAFTTLNPYKEPSDQWFLHLKGREVRKGEGQSVRRPSPSHLSIATGGCSAQEKCAYIITYGPGILQRAVLIAEAQSRGGNERLRRNSSRRSHATRISDILGSLSERSVLKYSSRANLEEVLRSSEQRPEA